MYAKVNLEVESHDSALLVPKVAVIDADGQRGIYQANEDNRAQFKAIKLGLEDADHIEVLEGLAEGETIVSTGAGALRKGDQLVIAGQGGPGGGQGGRGRGGRGGQNGQNGPGGASSGMKPGAVNSEQQPAGTPRRPPQ